MLTGGRRLTVLVRRAVTGREGGAGIGGRFLDRGLCRDGRVVPGWEGGAGMEDSVDREGGGARRQWR